MPITETQREQRKKHIGSSDMAAIMGLSPFKTAYDVYLEKTQELEEQKESTAMARGNYLEGALLDFAEDNIGKLTRNQYRRAEGLPLAANCDAIVNESGFPVEAKSQGAFSNEHWGDAGTDDMPHRVLVQAHVHMLCTEQDYCHVPAYLPYREFQLFGVEKDKEISEIIAESALDFWNNHVLKDIPPDGQANIDILKRIKREPESIVDIDPGLVDGWLLAKESKKMAEDILKRSQAAIVAALGTSEAGRCAEGLVTYLSQSRTGIDSKLLKADMPEIAEKYKTLSTFRVARFKKEK